MTCELSCCHSEVKLPSAKDKLSRILAFCQQDQIPICQTLGLLHWLQCSKQLQELSILSTAETPASSSS